MPKIESGIIASGEWCRRFAPLSGADYVELYCSVMGHGQGDEEKPPVRRENRAGVVSYRNKGKLHRIDGPAIIDGGTENYYLDDVLMACQRAHSVCVQHGVSPSFANWLVRQTPQLFIQALSEVTNGIPEEWIRKLHCEV